MNTDTICAVATAPGGALGIVRVSGPEALPIVGAFCPCVTATTPANTVHFTRIIDQADIIDEAMVSVFRAPHSYTGEDCAEISCHGSHYILNNVIELLIRNGARLAYPGEFTQRAFLNGKMDLSQAEAVADLIASKNKASHDLAIKQLRGGISSELKTLRDQLLRLTSLLELELDFSDHEELEFADRTELLTLAETIDQRITSLARSFETGQAIKSGIPVAIVGKTNVGKSTLLNQLVAEERAIVSDTHGTTRDTIEDTMDIHGITFRIIDTAGIRQTSDAVERIGIERTYAAIGRARIVLWIIDSEPAPSDIREMLELTNGKSLIVIQNKCDIKTDFTTHLASSALLASATVHSISAKQGTGISSLLTAIYRAAHIPELSENNIIVTNARHYEALCRAHDSLSRVIHGLTSSLPSDLIAEDLRLTLDALADITGGAITPQETLNNIFSHFCVGK